jgi:hypothetical protein
VGMWTPFDRR